MDEPELSEDTEDEARQCPHCGAGQRREDGYLHTVGVVVRGGYDGTLYWMCPFCDGTWHRWAQGTPQYALAFKLGVRTLGPSRPARPGVYRNYSIEVREVVP